MVVNVVASCRLHKLVDSRSTVSCAKSCHVFMLLESRFFLKIKYGGGGGEGDKRITCEGVWFASHHLVVDQQASPSASHHKLPFHAKQ